MAERITPRSEDFSQWYVDVVTQAELAEYAPVRGCMVIRPNGFAIWENIQRTLDTMFKETGHKNAYFPLFIPESFLKKEAEHVEGFAPECAVVTIGGSKELEEPLIVRPTSETIIWAMYKKWIQSYRDLPILINQWANIVRWEMRTRLFLRTLEFLWQEGHTAHSTHKEAQEEALLILDIYRKFAEEYMAMPVYTGYKTEKEKFAGALTTYSIEALMQDGKALQAGTSHDLGQNFAKAFDVTFQNEKGELEYVWATSWGVSTRLVGALVMTHSDDQGLVIPPKLAPNKVVIIPIFKSESQKEKVISYAKEVFNMLPKEWNTIFDNREQYTPGWKFNEWELKGIPVRLEIGPRDIEGNNVVVVRRDNWEKIIVSKDAIKSSIESILNNIQIDLYKRALHFLQDKTKEVDSYKEFQRTIEEEQGFVIAPWGDDRKAEEELQEETKATIRIIPFENKIKPGDKCIKTGKPAKYKALFAKSY